MGFSQARILEWVAISFSKGVFPTQGSNLGLLHWRADSGDETDINQIPWEPAREGFDSMGSCRK